MPALIRCDKGVTEAGKAPGTEAANVTIAKILQSMAFADMRALPRG